MKKILFFFCWALLLLSSAQTNAQFKASAKAGITSDRILPGENGDGSKAGFLIGAFGEYDVEDWFGFRAGLQFMQKGCAYKAATVTSNIQFFDHIERISLNYLQIPLNLVFRKDVNVGNQIVGISAGAGLYGAFLYGGTATCQFSEQYEGKIIDHNVKNVAKIGLGDGSQNAIVMDRFNTFDAGADLSIEIMWKLFSMGLGYQKGFVDINTGAPYVKSGACRTSSVIISLGYYFM